jgi:hypothetical protein
MSRLSYANVAATLALFVALGGSATAVTLITGRQVRNDSLTGKDVRNGSLTLRDWKKSERRRLRGPRGSAGPQGPQGSPGAQGPQGVSGETGAGLTHQVLGKITEHAGGTQLRYGHLFGVYQATQFPGQSWEHSPQVALRLRSVRVWNDTGAFQGGSSFTFQLWVDSSQVPGFTCVVEATSCDIPGETVIPANTGRVFWSIQAAGNASASSQFTVTGELVPG